MKIKFNYVILLSTGFLRILIFKLEMILIDNKQGCEWDEESETHGKKIARLFWNQKVTNLVQPF